MPVQRVGKSSQFKKTITKKSVSSGIDISLPDGPTQIAENLWQYTWLIYGERKIGKTKLLSHFDKPLFLMFDPLNSGLSLNQKYVKSWKQFKGILNTTLPKKLKENPNYCKMVVIDTGFMAYERCYQYMVKDILGIESARNNDHGFAWKEVSREFMEAHDMIFELGLGLAVTAHSDVAEITRKDGSKYNKLTTQLGAQAFKFYNGTLDFICYYHYNLKNERELAIRGDSLVEAGMRVDDHFMYTNGKPIKNIPMGNSSKESYRNLELAFNNKLTEEVSYVAALKKYSQKEISKLSIKKPLKKSFKRN